MCLYEQKHVDSNPVPPKDANLDQWETWVQGYNQGVVYTVPMVGPASYIQMQNPVAKLICPENDIGRAQYELMIAKGSNVDAKGSGYTLSNFSKMMIMHVYRTLDSKYQNNTAVVVGSTGGRGKGAAGKTLGKRRDRGASGDAAAAGTTGVRRARLTMVDLKESLDNLAQNRAQPTLPPGMILLSAAQWDSLKSAVEKSTTALESLQTEVKEHKKAVEEQTSRADKIMAALKASVSAKAAAVTVNVHKGGPPTEGAEAADTPVTGNGAIKKLPAKKPKKMRDEEDEDEDDSSESESESDSDDEKEDEEEEEEDEEEEEEDEEKEEGEEDEKGEEGEKDDVVMAEAEAVVDGPVETQAETQASPEAPEGQMAEENGENGENGEENEATN